MQVTKYQKIAVPIAYPNLLFINLFALNLFAHRLYLLFSDRCIVELIAPLYGENYVVRVVLSAELYGKIVGVCFELNSFN